MRADRSTCLNLVVAVVVSGLVALPRAAHAVPRFAARTGMPCVACHVNPSGGGMRNAFGRNVYERHMLPWPDAAEEPASDSGGGMRNAADAASWFELGGDLRAAYFFAHSPEPKVENLNSFFLMQADLYASARAGEHLTFYLDRGVYGSFEAFALLEWPAHGALMLPRWYLKLGRFLPAYGLKDPNHTLTVREGIGFSQVAKDTGLEAGLLYGPATLQLALTNGTANDEQLDSSGTSRRNFEKAVIARAELRGRWGGARLFTGGSLFWNDNVRQTNPLAPPDLVKPADQPLVGVGLRELRTGVFGGAFLGRLGLLGEIDYVRDNFFAPGLPAWHGYASFAELSFLPWRGLDLLATYEFKDPDLDVRDDATRRVGGVIELYPIEYLEVRLQYRYTLSALGLPSDGAHELVAYVHAFL